MDLEINSEKCWCGSSITKLYKKVKYNNNFYELHKCIECSTIRVKHNSSINYTNDKYLSTPLSYRHKKSLETILEYIKEGSLLDIGCNNGIIMNEIIKIIPNLKVEGVEVNKKALDNLVVDKNIVHNCLIDELNKKYNNIILVHTLEHIPNLIDFFESLKKILYTEAIVYISVPNLYSFNAKFDLENWGALNPEEHIWFFSNKTITKLIKFVFPNSKVLCNKTSWVWPRKYNVINKTFQGDQIEIVFQV